MDYSFRLTARVLLYAPSHREDSTYHSLWYTSRGALAGTRNGSMGPPWKIDPTTHRTMSERSYHRATSCFHIQDSTYHDLCYTSRGALAGTWNSSMDPPHEGSIWRPIAPWGNALTTELHLAPLNDWAASGTGNTKQRTRAQGADRWTSACPCRRAWRCSASSRPAWPPRSCRGPGQSSRHSLRSSQPQSPRPRECPWRSVGGWWGHV